MGNKLTFQEISQRAKEIHKTKYILLESSFIDTTTEMKIWCNVCQKYFKQKPSNHLNGSGCPTCGNKRKNKERQIKAKKEFPQKVFLKHGDRYDLSKFTYTSAHETSIAICKIHGEFPISPANLLSGRGCRDCGIQRRALLKIKRARDKFISAVYIKYDNMVDLSQFIYLCNFTRSIAICKIHGEFLISPSNLLGGNGCPDCVKEKRTALSIKKAEKKFRSDFYKKYKNKFDLCKFIYLGRRIRSIAICQTHGEFLITAESLLAGHGCLRCNASLGEIEISRCLDSLKINFSSEVSFSSLYTRRKFDFYFPDYDLYVEYQGIQHYEPIAFFGGEKGFKLRQIKDQYKRDWCKENNHRLLEIPYWDFDKIEEILKRELKALD